MNRLQKLLNILSLFPKKSQNVVLSVIDFDNKSPSENYVEIVDTMIAVCKNAQQRELLSVYREVRPTDNEVLSTFTGGTSKLAPIGFNEDQLEYIMTNVYRNRDGDFRLIPKFKNCSAENMPLEGLKADEDIISARLSSTRIAPNGMQEDFNGLKELKKQPYDGPFDGVYSSLGANLKRIKIISSFDTNDPHGFFVRNAQMYRNVCSQLTPVNQDLVTDTDLRRAMFLTFLVSGGTREDWEALYNLVHFMVRVPNSATGYVLYLNDFDAGGNGKSKFIGLLRNMFGDAFTSFATQQLRFTMSLLGKRLVSISEYEENANAKELQAIIKSMTGRDDFQYEGKGLDPIVASTYQNFIISSNRYIYFDDFGIKRRIQNFHCCNLLHLILNKYTRNQDYLNRLFGNVYNGESASIQKRMAHSMLHQIYSDDRTYAISIRPQSIILGSLKNPILRALFSPSIIFKSFCMELDGHGKIDLIRLCPEAKPEQLNYASQTLQNWLPELELEASRDNTTLVSKTNLDDTIATLNDKLAKLDMTSNRLKAKDKVTFERCEFLGFDSYELFKEFLLPECEKNNIPVIVTDDYVQIT